LSQQTPDALLRSDLHDLAEPRFYPAKNAQRRIVLVFLCSQSNFSYLYLTNFEVGQRANHASPKMSKDTARFFQTAGNETAKLTLKHAAGPVPHAPKSQ
jgi:hypothetical protein